MTEKIEQPGIRLGFVAAVGTLLCAGGTHANSGPPAYIFDFAAEQDGQDVVLNAGLAGNYGQAIITRIDAATDESVEIGDLAAGELIETVATGMCGFWDDPQPVALDALCGEHPGVCVDCDDDNVPECYPDCAGCPDAAGFGVMPDDCESLPFFCADCDGDDVPECYGGCAQASHHELVDECVPPGDYAYRIVSPAEGGSDEADLAITVEDVAYDECADSDAGTDADTDADTGGNPDADTDAEDFCDDSGDPADETGTGEDCGCRAAGARPVSSLISMLVAVW